MKLCSLLSYDNIIIQCHDHPDADAVASGYGLYLYLKAKGKHVQFVYGGSEKITKSNLVLMISKLQIPIRHVKKQEDLCEKTPDLLVTVDCQYGEHNVQQFFAGNVAVIDHHTRGKGPARTLAEIREQYGSCSTVIWDMLRDEGFDASLDRRLATALYYGLYMDTCHMQEISHPKDRDMRDALEFHLNKSVLNKLQNCNLSREELIIAGKSMAGIYYDEQHQYAIAGAERCDPNILGIISDALIEVDSVNTCVSFCQTNDGIKLSVRSCERETRADELAHALTKGMGSGGGHIRKSGGFLKKDALVKWYQSISAVSPSDEDIEHIAFEWITNSMQSYFKNQDLFFAGSESTPDLSGEPVYEKLPLPIGYARAKDLYPVGTIVTVRMLEGDMPLLIQDDTYFIIGVESEVYTNDEAYFLSHNVPSDKPYEIHGEYAPTIHTAVSSFNFEKAADAVKSLSDFAKTCIPKEKSRIFARQVKKRTKVFVSWSEGYLLGMPGDYLAARVENPKDIYIIKKEVMGKSYQKASL